MLRRYAVILFSSAMIAAISTSSSAATTDALKTLRACRVIANEKERLSCFDKSFDMIDARINAGEIGVVDLKSRQNRQRKAFGLAGRADQAPVVEKLTSVSSRITGLAPNADGSWVVTLADGTQWRTAGDLSGKVAVGNDVVVTRDAFSRYKMASKTGRKAIVYRIR